MALCPCCFFSNDADAVVCAGPGCGERLPRPQLVCRLHRLPKGATVCHICAAQDAARTDRGGAREPTRGYFPAVMDTPAARKPDVPGSPDARPALRRVETADLRLPAVTPDSPAARLPSLQERLQRVHGEAEPPPAARAERAAEERLRPMAAAAIPPAHAAPRRETVIPQDESAAESARPRASQARLAGLLVTYSWNLAGQMVPLREGLNRIGSSPDCEVHVPGDQALSPHHASIHVGRGFLINDLDSQEGTRVNDKPIDELYVRLENYARIAAGKTLWIFIMIEPAPSGGVHLAPDRPTEAGQQKAGS